ncbi:unnamed protein product [Symbiodinium sp. CCMP2592]|nr:unnamed protein product [Symbiodinium sp. CCMP2592]
MHPDLLFLDVLHPAQYFFGHHAEDDGFSFDMRAAYIEPFPTDEEQRRKKESKRRRFFWQDKYQPPDIVEIACVECGQKNWLDAKWLKAKKGGMQSAVCVRCRSILAGVA